MHAVSIHVLHLSNREAAHLKKQKTRNPAIGYKLWFLNTDAAQQLFNVPIFSAFADKS